MITFYSADMNTSEPLIASYSYSLVILSYIVATVAAYAGFRLGRYARHTGNRRWIWFSAGGLTMGTGVWAMHFTGMLAFALPIPVAYDALTTFVSALPAILCCTCALVVSAKAEEHDSHVLKIAAGTALGAGIGVMHYTGMAAVRMNALLFYDRTWFALSIGVAVVLGILAIYADMRRGSERTGWIASPVRIVGAAIMGLAVSGMHYVAMEATVCVAADTAGAGSFSALNPHWLATNVAAVSVILAIAAVVAAKIDRYVAAAHDMVRANRRRMFAAIESISDGFLLFDESGRLVISNKVFSGMYPSLKPLLVPGTKYETILRAWAAERKQFPEGQDRESYVRRCLSIFHGRSAARPDSADEDQLSDGRWTIVRQQPMDAGGLVGVWSDVTGIKERQALYELLASTDSLTGLPNRHQFRVRLSDAMKRSRRSNLPVALMFLDLDRFKLVNDTYGHDAGDRVLETVATRLKSSVRETDFVARLGGDEFVIILEQVANIEVVERIAGNILEKLSERIDFNGHECSVGASIGISIYPDHAEDEEGLLKRADETMYDVKRAGRNDFRIC